MQQSPLELQSHEVLNSISFHLNLENSIYVKNRGEESLSLNLKDKVQVNIYGDQDLIKSVFIEKEEEIVAWDDFQKTMKHEQSISFNVEESIKIMQSSDIRVLGRVLISDS